MSGSAECNAKLTAVVAGMEKALEAAMDMHIVGSESYGKSDHPWEDKSGATSAGITHATENQGTQIISTVAHSSDVGLYLEKAWFFGGKYKLIERARSHNLAALWTHLRAIMSGTGYIRGG